MIIVAASISTSTWISLDKLVALLMLSFDICFIYKF